MTKTREDFIFKPEQQEDVDQGRLCPYCLGTKIQCVTAVPDGMRMNYGYDCQNPDCLGQWEGE